MACEYDLVEGVLKVNCKGCVYGSNIEDFEACMSTTIDKLMQNKGVSSVVLAESRDNEYNFEQTRMLMEIADAYDLIINEENLLAEGNIAPPGCEMYIPSRRNELSFLVNQALRKDPIGAYVRLERMITREKAAASNSTTRRKRECHLYFIRNSLEPIKKILDKTRMVQRARPYLRGHRIGDRGIYRDIFNPIIRPNFMMTRYHMLPPKNARMMKKYSIGNISVEIFKVPGEVRARYYIIPPEFKLSEEKYKILDAARQYISEHRPGEQETSEPDQVREVFKNIGRGLVKDISKNMGMMMSSAEVEELATILARYTAGFGVLELLLSDQNVQDMYINSPIGGTPIYIYHSEFEECETNLIPTREDADAWATRFRLYSGRPLDESNPVLDTELVVPGGRARVAAITNSLSPEGLAFAFRRHRERPWTFPLFIKSSYISPLYAGLMSFIIDGGRACLIAGGRSSGKTSLLGAMLLEVMRKHRVIIQEDTLELPVNQLRDMGYNIERLKSRSVITQVETELSADDALRTALRLGDSVLILGEVRSVEGKALFEAMRIGALAHFVGGTIHGESAFGVYDRVVNDLGVPNTSFKAIDLITIANLLRSPDGMSRFRRVIGLTEVRKHWKEDPMEEGGFVNLMEYSSKEDKLKPTSVLLDGESEVLSSIATRVRDWHGRWDDVWENILLRSKIKETILDYSKSLGRDDILEAVWTAECNDMFHIISDVVKQEVGGLDSELIYNRWENWFKDRLKMRPAATL